MGKTAQGSASRANAMNMRPSLWELSCEANELWLLTGENLLETDECYLANFAARLERAEIRGLRDLIAADNVLELTFAPHPRTMLVHRRVLEKVKAFITQYPGIMGVLPLEESTTYRHAALRAKPGTRGREPAEFEHSAGMKSVARTATTDFSAAASSRENRSHPEGAGVASTQATARCSTAHPGSIAAMRRRRNAARGACQAFDDAVAR